MHLNGAGFDDHATQWREILGGSGVLILENGDFEKGFDPSVTTIAALSENGQSIIDPFVGGIHQGVVDWVVLMTVLIRERILTSVNVLLGWGLE